MFLRLGENENKNKNTWKYNEDNFMTDKVDHHLQASLNGL